ncbi:transcriptional regulator, TetR family [Hyphomonas neptunium ATCC 15444]|uniref:Transcriptional regulator, TetR family n=2 Tax=Hyphomonas TaxID=85 RepID=Q0C0B6_HYPNA|nr:MULTISPECIES: TetR/AcrR family transcriptional regulator [Hyphomonas]ABI75955.1 transcriptional regulator, TetR family [Hyphomonas neptunium ATCC 15444]KCZ90592.1 TetR family transcriptional regulator [Hyphomonas hirschiana VP5]
MAKTPKTEKPEPAQGDTASEIKYPRRTERRRRTRLKILEVAVRQFSKSGFSATTMQNIADEADIHVTTLFMHFNSKNELATSLANDAVDRLRDRVLAARGSRPFFEFFREEALTYAANRRSVSQPDAALWNNLRKDQELAFAWTSYEYGQKGLYAEYIASEYDIDRTTSYLADLIAALVVECLILPHERWAQAPGKRNLAEEIEQAVNLTERAAKHMLKARDPSA